MRSKQSIRVGDTVAYSVKFLRGIACYTGNLPRARGRVKYLTRVGSDGKGVFLAAIDWGFPDVPEKVNVANLERIESE
jgi:hypothetical protein